MKYGLLLSKREKKVVHLIAAGNTNKEIARLMGIAPETVKSHIKSIFIKLDVDNRAQAVARSMMSLVMPRQN